MAELKEYPKWVRDELANPVVMGEGRNNQLIKIAPTLLRHGHDVDSLYELFCDLYPDATSLQQQHEILAVCKSALKYVGKEDKAIAKSDYLKWKRHLNEMTSRTRGQFNQIMDAYRWSPEEFTGPSAQWSLAEQRYTFLKELYGQDEVVWIGMVWETGERVTRSGRKVNYVQHFKPVSEWLAQPHIRGEFLSHCTFQPGTNSRNNESVQRRAYVVVESDVLKVDQIGAVFNYLSSACNLNLRAIVSTGGKSIHGWFSYPINANEAAMAEWGAVLSGLKCDPSTLRPSQPVRLPGTIRKDTKRPQQLLYLA